MQAFTWARVDNFFGYLCDCVWNQNIWPISFAQHHRPTFLLCVRIQFTNSGLINGTIHIFLPCFNWQSSRFFLNHTYQSTETLILPGTQDTIPIHPSHFGIPADRAITNELNKKYANKVLHDLGLCICVFDLTEVGEGRVRYGDGFLWYKGRLIVSRRTMLLRGGAYIRALWSCIHYSSISPSRWMNNE